MHLIFIRHADPDYKNDSLTEKGFREAELLAKRASSWKNIEHIYVSPMGRAQKTADEILKSLNLTFSSEKVSTLDWLREFSYPVKDLKTGKQRISWDWLPQDYFADKKFFDVNEFYKNKTLKNANIEFYYNQVCSGLDEILETYDYNRLEDSVPIYNCFPHLTQEESQIDTHLQQNQKDLDERNLVFVCHLGVMFVMISHLLKISPVQLWQGFFVAPSSVTILGSQERVPGELVWRIQSLGDVNHLLSNGESVSASGFFGNCLNF